jgi:MFS family permease
MFLIGVLPGFATLWIRRGIPESGRWEEIRERRRAALERKQSGAALEEHERSLTRFTLTDLFAVPEIRRRTIIALLMSFSTTFGWWGISSWIPPYIASVAAKAGLVAPQWASFAGMAYNAGAILGYIGLGFLADRFGRKPVTLVFYAMAFVMTPVLFLWTHDLQLLLIAACITGLFSLGQFSWMATWLPELYPTRLRGTGIAFCFNAPRFVAWLGPLFAGALIAHFGGFGRAAMSVAFIYILGLAATPFLPETRGKPLPETI